MGTRGHGDGDTGTRGRGDTETRGHGDTETRGHGDTETRGHGDTESGDTGNSPRRPFAASLCRPFATSPRRPFATSPRRPFATSPRRLIVLLIITLALSACVAPVRVEWSTETEMNTAGFNLRRGESADGPFDVKVNDQLIPPAADPLTGGKYEYVDKTARPGVTYYYRLEEVERNGGTNNFGPISVRGAGVVAHPGAGGAGCGRGGVVAAGRAEGSQETQQG